MSAFVHWVVISSYNAGLLLVHGMQSYPSHFELFIFHVNVLNYSPIVHAYGHCTLVKLAIWE